MLRNQQPPVLLFLAVCRAVAKLKVRFEVSQKVQEQLTICPSLQSMLRGLWRIWQAPCPPGKEDRYRDRHIIVIQWIKRGRRKARWWQVSREDKIYPGGNKYDLTDISSGGFTNFQLFYEGNLYPRVFLADKRVFQDCFCKFVFFLKNNSFFPGELSFLPTPHLSCLLQLTQDVLIQLLSWNFPN